MVMDWLRSCYRCQMRFWDGGETRLVPVRWFFADENAQLFDGPHAYTSCKTWDRDYVNDGPGEDLREGTEYDKGPNKGGYFGLWSCGSEEAPIDGGVWERDEHIETDEGGWCDCCGVKGKKAVSLAGFGGAVFISYQPPPAYPGLVVGGTGYKLDDFRLKKAKKATFAVHFDGSFVVEWRKAKRLSCVVVVPHASGSNKAKRLQCQVSYPATFAVELHKSKRGEAAAAAPQPALAAQLRKAKGEAAQVDARLRVPAVCRKAKREGAAVVVLAPLPADLHKSKRESAQALDVLAVAADLHESKRESAQALDVLAVAAGLRKSKRESVSVAAPPLAVSAGLRKAKQETAGVEDMPTLNSVNGCRLSPQAGTSCPTGDFAGVTRVYLEPHVSNQIALYSVSSWAILTVNNVFLDLLVTAGKVYDVFCFYAAGSPALELGPAWINDTLRSTNIVRQDGVWVKQGDPTRRWVGTLKASGTNMTDDTAQKRWLWNWQNQEPRPLASPVQVSNYQYNVDNWRQVFANASNQVSVVRGDDSRAVVLRAMHFATNSVNFLASTGIGLDSTGFNNARLVGTGGGAAAGDQLLAEYVGCPGIGARVFNWLERAGSSGNTQFFGQSGSAGQGGLHGFVWG